MVKRSTMKRTYLIFIFFFFAYIGYSQDAFFYGNKQINGFLNPALTGINGALSFTLIGKEQYINTLGDFFSGGLSIEQSWPCHKIDAGVFHVFDKEGDGLFTTNHTGASIVYTIPFNFFGELNNIRIGFKPQFTQKSVDWSKLTFSDQINPKYNLEDGSGGINQSAFNAPTWNTLRRFTLGVGAIYKVDVGRVYKWSMTCGFSIENFTNLSGEKDYDSILRLPNESSKHINKWSLYMAPEFPLTKAYNNYFGFRPSLIMLREGTFTNLQLGFEVNYRRAYSLGFYFGNGHYNDFDQDTKTLVFDSNFRLTMNRTSQLSLGFQYIHNIGGFSEVFGQSLQVTIGYYFKNDGCASTPTTRSDCPPTSKSHRSLYENIWGTSVQGINQ